MTKEVPLLRLWHETKRQHPDKILLFRCGDIYMTYNEDAKTCARLLGLTLVARTDEGRADNVTAFPWYELANYNERLRQDGHTILINESPFKSNLQ